MITWKKNSSSTKNLVALDGFVGEVCLYYVNYYPQTGCGNCGVGCDHEEYGDAELINYAEPLTPDEMSNLERCKQVCEDHFESWLDALIAKRKIMNDNNQIHRAAWEDARSCTRQAWRRAND